MKARRLPFGAVSVEMSAKEAGLVWTALHTHKVGNREAVAATGIDDRAARQLLADADAVERLADELEGAL